MSANTRELIRQFNVAFDRPVNRQWTTLTVTERELLGKLLLEETLEYVTKGLGLRITIEPDYSGEGIPVMLDDGVGDPVYQSSAVQLELNEGQVVDNVEVVDGLADVNVVIHFCAHWHGFNLDKATEIVNESNMSKLGPDGKPIINGVTPGYRPAGDELSPDFPEDGYALDKPIGKILKGPNFVPPTHALRALIMEGTNE